MPILPPQLASIYHARPELSHSQLKDFSRSPWDFYMRHRYPLRPLRSLSTPSQTIGEILHCAVLEPQRFLQAYSAGPDVSRITKEWKVADQEAKEDGRILLKGAEWRQVTECAESVRSHPVARKILEDQSLSTEVSATWELGGVKCRGRFDAKTNWCLADLKTSCRGGPENFMWEAEKYHYNTQAAYYQTGLLRATDAAETLPFMFIVVDAEYPYKCYVYRATDDFMERGHALVKRWLDEYFHCYIHDRWPCDNDCLIELTPPPNAKWRDNDE